MTTRLPRSKRTLIAASLLLVPMLMQLSYAAVASPSTTAKPAVASQGDRGVNPIPYKCAIPYLNVRGGWRALKFYQNAFGAKVIVSLSRHGGKLAHAEIHIGDAVVMLRDEYPEMHFMSPQSIGGVPLELLVYVKDVRTFTQHAVEHGAKVLRPIQMQFHGDLMVELEDPFGYVWFFATRVETMTPEKLKEQAKKAKL